jgi:hypothetical protein
MEKMWILKPRLSSRRISFEMKVSEMRGKPFRIIPRTGALVSGMRSGPESL